MTGRERLLCTLRGEKADRVPVSIFVQEDYLSYYYHRAQVSRVTDAVNLAKELGFDVMTRHMDHIQPHYTRHSFPNWEVDRRTCVESGNMYRAVTITTPKGVLRQVEAAPYDPRLISGTHFVTQQYLIDSAEAFEIFRAYVPPVDRAYADEIARKAVWARGVIGDAGIACPWGTGGIYNTASTLRNIQDLMMDPYDEDGFYGEFMDLLTRMIEQDYDILAKTEYEALGMQGNIANASLIGESYFDEFILPYEKRVADVVKANGKAVLYHNCGVAKGLYNCYKKLDMTVFETLSPPPQGDNDLAEAKKLLGGQMVLSGNLDQVRFLKTASPREVAQKTEEIMSAGKPGGRYIFATSDYLETGTPIENVKSMIETAKRCGAYA